MDAMWHKNIMAKAKCQAIEVMERLNKEDADDLDGDEIEMYKNAAKTLYYIMSVEKAMEAK